MEFLTTCGSEEIDDWSVSLGQDAIGTPETVKETRLELNGDSRLPRMVLDEETAQLKQQAAQIQKVSAQLELTNPVHQTVLPPRNTVCGPEQHASLAIRQRGGIETPDRERRA